MGSWWGPKEAFGNHCESFGLQWKPYIIVKIAMVYDGKIGFAKVLQWFSMKIFVSLKLCNDLQWKDWFS